MSFWNDENTALAVKLWDDGLSATQVAQAVGAASKNAIIGKIGRMRAAGHPFTRQIADVGSDERKRVSRAGGLARVYAKKTQAAKRPQKPKPNNLSAVNMVRRAERDAAKAEPLPAVITHDATFAKPWLERLFGECAYPIIGEGADTISCCIRTGGKTYCTGHQKLMYRKAEKTGADYVKSAVRLAA